MSDLIEDLLKIQKQAQQGISGYGKNLYYNVNDFCAEVYGVVGRAQQRIEELSTWNHGLEQTIEGLEIDREGWDAMRARIKELEAQLKSLGDDYIQTVETANRIQESSNE